MEEPLGFLFLVFFLLFVIVLISAIVGSIRRRRSRWNYLAAAICFGISMVFGAIERPPPPAQTQVVGSSKEPTPKPARAVDIPRPEDTLETLMQGDTAVILGSPGIPCFDTSATLDAYDKAMVNDDRYGLADAREKSIVIPAGVHVRAIDSGGLFGIEDVRLRIESGDNEGVACWIDADLRGTWGNIHHRAN